MTKTVRAWLRASLQGTIVLGLAMIAVVWTGVWVHLGVQRETAIRGAFHDTANLARSFEEHIKRFVQGYDDRLLVLRELFYRDSSLFGARGELKSTPSTLANFRFGIFDSNGQLIASSFGTGKPLNVADRDHFRFHVTSDKDQLFVGRPVRERMTANVAFHLTRRLEDPDGAFAGTITASIDPTELLKFYQTINIGEKGAISLIGADGYIRACHGLQTDITQLPPNRGVLQHMKTNPAGNYINDGRLDGVVRIISYREVAGLPLTVLVGLAESEVLAPYYRSVMIYGTAGGAITALVIMVMVLSILHRRKLEQTYRALRASETESRQHRKTMRTALDNISQGILMADADGSIVVINRRLIELLELPPGWLKSPPTIRSMVRYLIDRGEYGVNGSLMDAVSWQNLLMGGVAVPVSRYERTRPNGIVLAVNARELPDGGMVRTFSDITERKHAEARIAEMATHDDLTGLANRSLFRDRVDELFLRAQRTGERFALLLLDLDRFKPINDMFGHLAGDGVLKEVAARLQSCAGEKDTVARLGGDEFAILIADASDEGAIAALADGILRAIAVPITIDEQHHEIGITIGAVIAGKESSYSQLLMMADQALYTAKKEGRNRYCFARSGFLFRLPTARSA